MLPAPHSRVERRDSGRLDMIKVAATKDHYFVCFNHLYVQAAGQAFFPQNNP